MKRVRGFTLVELIVTISVLGILAGVVVVSYGQYQQRVADTQVRDEVKTAQNALNNYRNFNGGFPDELSAVMKQQSPDVTLKYFSLINSFCLQGTSVKFPTIKYHIFTQQSEPSPGICEL